MAITSLKITDFRNIAYLEVQPFPAGLNIIHGNNGSGKTSILEAIYYIGMGKSFRTATPMRLIRQAAEKFSIVTQQIMSGSDCTIPIGVERDHQGASRLRIDEKEVSNISEIVKLLPIRMINSHSHSLFESGPAIRRKYLDWGLFYGSTDFLSIWRNFERSLKQRNMLLREKAAKREIDPWTQALAGYGLALDALRRDYVQRLVPMMQPIAADLLGVSQLTIDYLPGWEEGLAYAQALERSYGEEYRVGATRVGPHRADIEVRLNGLSAKHFLSRGQQKLLICAMILAQGALAAEESHRRIIYLVDDLPSELDAESRTKLISLLAKQKTQVFITAIEGVDVYQQIGEALTVPVKLFHVEHGRLR
ncbi:MAG TPA: DNA replication/repair protein RecF [Gammaproteobacteria bacterium]|nr:DNA replication/repair protein RecF [Gammaproteobacteria bacterium]